jgi:hypothetical protein
MLGEEAELATLRSSEVKQADDWTGSGGTGGLAGRGDDDVYGPGRKK